MKTVSFVIPTLNEERNLMRCLNSLGRLTYPHDHLEIIIADAHSTDRTLELIDQWRSSNDIRLEVVPNDRVVAEFGKAAALKRTRGDFLCVLDCDEEIVRPDTVETYLQAFELFPDIVGVEHCFLKLPDGGVLNNYFALRRLTDPLARDITIEPRLLEKRSVEGKIFRHLEFSPAYPTMLFARRDALAEYLSSDTWEEGQVILGLALSGRNRMCQIDGYGVRHYHLKSFGDFMRKRAKIALKHTTRIRERKTWVSYTGRRMPLFAALHLTFVYPFLYSLYRMVRDREPLWLVHAPICFLTTLTYAINWLRLRLRPRRAW